MNTTGEAYLTISSTAPSSRLSMSARSKARWSGSSVSSISACDSAVRVVSLPAVALGGHPRRDQVLARRLGALGAQRGDHVGQLLAGAEKLEHRLIHVLG